jgi:hypothetical protein
MLDIDQLVAPQSKTLNCGAWYEIGTDMQAHFRNVCRFPRRSIGACFERCASRRRARIH